MIEGNLEDISLPGLLQLLAAESTKSYRLRISKGGQNGDVFVCDGHLLVATFGILEGLDALSEFLNWSDGEFVVEKLPSHFKTTIRSNINLDLSDPGCFADQCAFLYESNVGLNTEIVPSRTFGTAEWQDALSVQPLEKEDYAILGWVTDGRTMRQAMREFQFDLKKTIGVLYRLLITRSVEVVRPTAFAEPPPPVDSFIKEVNTELAKHVEEPVKKQVTVEFHATDIGGARSRPRDTGSGMRALNPAAPSDNPLTSSPELIQKGDGRSPKKDETAKSGSNAESKSQVSDSKSGKEPADSKPPAKEEAKPSAKEEVKAPAKEPAQKTEEPKSSNGDAGKSSAPEKAVAKSADVKPAVKNDVGTDTVETYAVGKAPEAKTVGDAIAGDAEEVHDNFKKQLKKAASMAAGAGSETPVAVAAVSAPEVTAAKTASAAASASGSTTASKLQSVGDTVATVSSGVSKTADSLTAPASKSKDSEKNDGKTPRETQDKIPALEEAPTNTLSALLGAEFDEETVDIRKVEMPDSSKVLNVVAPAAPPPKQFDERRTDPLPLVSIDIERLLASTFQLTAIGQRAVTNTSLDELLKQVLLDVERGKTLLLVLTDSNRSESAVLASYRYCLDRGYIEHTDSVMSLTVDLLLGRLELEQYLLQRRRITGDQLRDIVAIANRQGIGLDKLLVAAGYMLPIDMERVRKEKERFCPR